MKHRKSLFSSYLVLIVFALLLVPVMFPLSTLVFYSPPETPIRDAEGNSLTAGDMERLWHAEAKRLSGADRGTIEERLRLWREQYPQSSIVWVGADGTALLRLPEDAEYPEHWSLRETIRFMKEGYDADPFTSVALLGETVDQGFIALQIPRFSFFQTRSPWSTNGPIIATLSLLCIFVLISALFFFRIRSRLLQLSEAMTTPAEHGIPRPVEVKRNDEIGQLETAFNEMIHQLEQSRRREREEEALRRQLIANLSHDLRTPLTAIRGHAYRLAQEELSADGRKSAQLIDRKISHMDRLIDNLLSYTMLSAGRYPYHPKETDIVRLVRNLCAGWYPTFEREGFEIDIDLPEEAILWSVDPLWMERVLDNVFQNVLRHAKSGRYLGVRIGREEGTAYIAVADRGPGMTGTSEEKGAGIGLSIADLMLKEMKLEWDFDSTPSGTTVKIVKKDG